MVNSLLGVVGLATVGLVLGGHGRTLLDKVRVDGHHAGGGLVRRHVARVCKKQVQRMRMSPSNKRVSRGRIGVGGEHWKERKETVLAGSSF